MEDLHIALVILGLAVLGYFVYRYWIKEDPYKKKEAPRPLYVYQALPEWDDYSILPLNYDNVDIDIKDIKVNSKPDMVIFRKTQEGKYYVQNAKGEVLLIREELNGWTYKTGWGNQDQAGKGDYKLYLFQPVPGHPDTFELTARKQKQRSPGTTYRLLWGKEARKDAEKLLRKFKQS